jgi:hypothetical protein
VSSRRKCSLGVEKAVGRGQMGGGVSKVIVPPEQAKDAYDCSYAWSNKLKNEIS